MKRVLAALMMLVLILPSTCYSMSYREGDKKTSGQDNIAPSINTSISKKQQYKANSYFNIISRGF